MCSGSPPAPVAPTPPPEAQDAGVVEKRDQERLRRRMAASNTVKTSSQGATGGFASSVKTLLGQ